MKKRLSDFTYSENGNIAVGIMIMLITTAYLVFWEISVSGNITGLEIFFVLYISSYDLLINSATKNIYIRISAKIAVLLGFYIIIMLLNSQIFLVYLITALNGIVLILTTLKSQNSLLKRFVFSFIGSLLPIISVLYLDYYANLYDLWADLPLLLFGIWALFFALTKIKRFYIPYIILTAGISVFVYLISIGRNKPNQYITWDALIFLEILLIMFAGLMIVAFYIYGKSSTQPVKQPDQKEFEIQ